MSDSESDITTEDDGRGLGDLDDDDGQPAGLFVGEDAGVGVVRDDEDAFHEGNVVREDGSFHDNSPLLLISFLPKNPRLVMQRMRMPMQMLRMTWRVLWKVYFFYP